MSTFDTDPAWLREEWREELDELLHDRELLREHLANQDAAIAYWQHATERARQLATRLEQELAQADEQLDQADKLLGFDHE